MKFQKHYGYEEVIELEWKWNNYFGSPCCLVRFMDGEESWSYPQDSKYDPENLKKKYAN